MSRCHGEVLLLSAFDMLPSTSPGTIGAVTLSLPVEGNAEAAALRKLALELATECDLHADVIVNHGHLLVRLARKQPMT